LPGSIGNKDLLPSLPPLSYKTCAFSELSLPHGLFDEGAPLDSFSPLDALMPIMAAQAGDQGPLVIVDGCKRFKKMSETGQERVACGIFEEMLDAKSIGLIRILLNQKRAMSIRESLCFFRWIKSNCEESGFEETADVLGFGSGRRSELEPLLTCTESVLDAVSEGRIAVRLAPDFCLLDSLDQEAYLDTFRALELSLQTQREFLEWLPEIAFARKTSVRSLMRSSDIRKITTNSMINNPQKIEALRSLLHSWKFPRFDEAQKKWKQLAHATTRAVLQNEPSSKVVFVPGPAFEMNKLEVRITLNHAPAAKEVFRKLSDIPQTTWAQLIYPLNNFCL
jgi:hypothetical protein